MTPPASEGADGDQFIIVASDGVWEFIASDEACRIVEKHKNATEACSALVVEAAVRWKRYEGAYRDDITAIVAFLPFLEAWGEEEEPATPHEAHEAEAEEEEAESTAKVFPNMGGQGLSFGELRQGGESAEAAEAPGSNEREEFAARRLSVHNPYDEDWNDADDRDDPAASDANNDSTQKA